MAFSSSSPSSSFASPSSGNKVSGLFQMATLASLASVDDVTNDTLAGGITEEEAPNGEDTTDKGAFITFRNTEQIILLSVLLAAIVIANAIVLFALCIGQRRRSRINFFIGHLAVADLLVGLLNVLPELIVRIETHFFSQYDILCKLARSSMVFPLILSSNVLVALSIDRFYVIVYPMKIGNEGSRSRLMILLAWLVTLAESIPFPFVFELNTDSSGETQCLVKTLESVWLTLYVIYACVISFAGPFVVIVGCYVIIIITVTKKANARGLAVNGITDGRDGHAAHRHGHGRGTSCGGSQRKILYRAQRSIPNSERDTSLGSATGGDERGLRRCTSGGQYERSRSTSSTMIASSRGIIPKAKIKTIKMTVIIVAAFAICWTPYWGYSLLNFRKKSTGQDAIWVIIQNLAPLNSAADPLIYAFFTTNLWKEFRRLRIVQIICGKCCKIQPESNPYNRALIPKQSFNKMASLNVTTNTSRARASSLSSNSAPSKKIAAAAEFPISRPRANSRTASFTFSQTPALSVIYSVDQESSRISSNRVERIKFLDPQPQI